MSAIETDSGHVLAVTVSNVGTTLDGDHALGATSLLLVDCCDFDDTFGGQLVIDGVTYAYSDVDDEASTVTISPGLAAGQDDATPVELFDPVTGKIATESIASVTLDGFDPGDVLQVHVRAALMDRLVGGVRGITGESVTLQRDEHGTWELVDVIGQHGERATAFLNTDNTTATADDATATLSLTYIPLDGSLHVRQNGVNLLASEWVLSGNVVTIAPSAGVVIRTGDVFDAAYAYNDTTASAAASVGSLFDEIMARHPVGFWNYKGDYTDDSGNSYTLTPGGGNAFVTSIVPREPTGQSVDMAPNLSWAYSSTPVAAVDAIDGVVSYFTVGRYVDGSVDGHFIGQAAPSGGGDHHFRFKYIPTTEQVLVEWYDGSTRSHTLDATGTFDTVTAFGITADGTWVILYANGVEVDRTAQLGAPASQAGGNYVAVGTDGATNNRWRGKKDADALFATALSPDDHLTLARAAGVA